MRKILVNTAAPMSQEMMHGLMAIFSLGAPKLFIGLNPPNFLNNSSSVIFYSK